MRKTCLAFAFSLLLSTISGHAAVEVPVTYDLGVKGGERIVGFITGGSICDAEGIHVKSDVATASVLYKYVDIDKISALQLRESGDLGFELFLRDGNQVQGSVSVVETEPMLILRDEIASGEEMVLGKERLFSKANFRGIPVIEFEAALANEASLDDLKAAVKKLQEALDGGNLEHAVEVHNSIGEMLEKLTEDNPTDGPGTTAKSTGTADAPADEDPLKIP
jgi:hypothetical protein